MTAFNSHVNNEHPEYLRFNLITPDARLLCHQLNELGKIHEHDRNDFLTPLPVAGPRIITNYLTLYLPKNGAPTPLYI